MLEINKTILRDIIKDKGHCVTVYNVRCPFHLNPKYIYTYDGADLLSIKKAPQCILYSFCKEQYPTFNKLTRYHYIINKYSKNSLATLFFEELL